MNGEINRIRQPVTASPMRTAVLRAAATHTTQKGTRFPDCSLRRPLPLQPCHVANPYPSTAVKPSCTRLHRGARPAFTPFPTTANCLVVLSQILVLQALSCRIVPNRMAGGLRLARLDVGGLVFLKKGPHILELPQFWQKKAALKTSAA